ncbi:hypothetical protein PFL02_47040 [Pseudomonas fluorescens]|nr:hypothetical protein PPC_3961 [Pseudomonas protegens Cab57]GED77854.1 hypothetical protein PFL02_47040 [Pseudomonas fluorescens]
MEIGPVAGAAMALLERASKVAAEVLARRVANTFDIVCRSPCLNKANAAGAFSREVESKRF